MKLITVILLFALVSLPAKGQTIDLTQQIRIKEGELAALKQQSAAANAPAMYFAMTEMVKASSRCVSDGIASKGRFTRTATVSKACREQAQLGAFAICATTVAQTGDTRDLNQCVAMMKNNGQWEQVWMRGIGVAGMVLGTREVGNIVVPLATAAINRAPPTPIIVDPVIVSPEVVNPVIVETNTAPQ